MRVPLFFVLLSLTTAAASAMQIGQTRDAITAQHGPPVEENHAKNTAVYRAGEWKVDVTYDDNVAKSLVFTKLDALTESDIAAILAQNADGVPWHELQMGTATRHWQGRDFSTAQCDRVRPRSIRIMDTPFRRIHQNASVPKAVVPSSARVLTPSSTKVLTTPNPGKALATPVPGTPWGGLLVLVGLVAIGSKVFLIRSKRRHSPKQSSARTVRPSKAPRATVPTSLPPPIPATTQLESPTIDSIRWDTFELVVAEIFRRKGYQVEIESALGSDGGKDITLRKGRELALVQCKNLARDNRVTASQMRDFFGLITAEHAEKGFFVTTGYFSADAKKFATGKPIELIERSRFEHLMEEVSRPGENLCDVNSWIDSFAVHARITDPVCPFCESPMKLRRGALGRPFWGCTRYGTHRCQGKRDGREELCRAPSA